MVVRILAPVLEILFNRNLNETFVPAVWKKALITPLFKKGSKLQKENYRPISLTCHLSKIMERVLKNHIFTYLQTYNKFEQEQHGFCQGLSTVTNLVEFYDFVFQQIDTGIPVDVIYYDLSKAFDKVSHQKLKVKLVSEGITGPIGNWVIEWLNDRRQSVVLDDQHSEWSLVTSGVPQGSVLAPLLFSLFIKGFAKHDECKIGKFADDTKTGSPANDVMDHYRIQAGIDEAANWCAQWQIPINLDKVAVMHFGNSNAWIQYHIMGRLLKEDVETRDLGIIIDNNLNFTKHSEQIVKDCNSLLYLINRTITSRNQRVYLQLYLTLLRPKLEYGVPFWEPLFKKDVLALESIQRKVTKKVHGLSSLKYEDRLKLLKLPTLVWRRKRIGLMYMFKVIRQQNIALQNSFFELRRDSRPNAMLTRGNDYKLVLSRVHYNAVCNSFRHRLIKLWNSLPSDIVNANSLFQFKVRLDNYEETKPELVYLLE